MSECQQSLRTCNFLLFLLLLWDAFSGNTVLRNYTCILRIGLQRCQNNSFNCSLEGLEMLKRPTSSVLCLRRDSGMNLLSSEQKMTSLSSYLLYFFFLATPHSMQNFPDQGSNPCPLQWKQGVLTTGPPG